MLLRQLSLLHTTFALITMRDYQSFYGVCNCVATIPICVRANCSNYKFKCLYLVYCFKGCRIVYFPSFVGKKKEVYPLSYVHVRRRVHLKYGESKGHMNLNLNLTLFCQDQIEQADWQCLLSLYSIKNHCAFKKKFNHTAPSQKIVK